MVSLHDKRLRLRQPGPSPLKYYTNLINLINGQLTTDITNILRDQPLFRTTTYDMGTAANDTTMWWPQRVLTPPNPGI